MNAGLDYSVERHAHLATILSRGILKILIVVHSLIHWYITGSSNKNVAGITELPIIQKSNQKPGTASQESGLDEQDSQWQWYMPNESSRSALFKNTNTKIVFVQIKKIITILLFCHIVVLNLHILLIYSEWNDRRLLHIAGK